MFQFCLFASNSLLLTMLVTVLVTMFITMLVNTAWYNTVTMFTTMLVNNAPYNVCNNVLLAMLLTMLVYNVC